MQNLTLSEMKCLNYSKKISLLFCLLFMLLYQSCSNDFDDFLTPNLSENVVYKADGKYAGILLDCSQRKGDKGCDFSTLPLLGMETDFPNKDDILKRLLVSHEWMGKRFEELIDSYPKELLLLFKSVSAIVIGADIRPSHFNSTNAVIYFDSNLFWLSENEKLTVNTKFDYRSRFSDNQDGYTTYVSRYIKEGKLAYKHISPKGAYQSRNLEDIRYLVAQTLIHELLHANDFFPVQYFETMPRNSVPQKIVSNLQNHWLSTRLENKYPLTSQLMKEMADYQFNSKDISEATNALPISDFIDEFNGDLATDFYGYSSYFEDPAMLFEEVMMKILFDVDREIAFVYFDPELDKLKVIWGVRNRFADKRLFEKVRFVMEDIIPPKVFQDFYTNNYPTLKTLERGSYWNEIEE